MQAFLEYVIKALVDRPDAVALTQVDRNGATVYELRVHPTDMGKIIGRQGATINAIRSLLLVGSAKQGLRCSLEVIDEEGGPGGGAGAGAEGAPAGEGGATAEGGEAQPGNGGENRPFRPGFRGGRGGGSVGGGGGGGRGPGRGPSRGGPRRGGGGYRGGGGGGRGRY